jgi:hypothetical protein
LLSGRPCPVSSGGLSQVLESFVGTEEGITLSMV